MTAHRSVFGMFPARFGNAAASHPRSLPPPSPPWGEPTRDKPETAKRLRSSHRAFLGLALGLTLARPAAAQTEVTFDLVNSKWTVAPDGRAVVESEVSMRLPKNGALRVAQVPVTWPRSLEALDIVQARVEKRDGRVIYVGKESVREAPPTGDQYFHEFSDMNRIIVTFLDAEGDDLLVMRIRRDLFRPRVPGGFGTAPVLARSVGWEETNYTISVPTGLPFQFETRGFDHETEVILDRTVHYFRSQKAAGVSRDVAVLGQFDRLPRFAVSTFQDWSAFARAYAGVLLPHAAVTPAVRAMAVKLTKGREETREQARVLYEWVRDNVRHVSIPLDESRPDPHDAEVVMNNLYGDSKDIVVLLRALLAARGIPAEPVLLNAGDSATIAGPPNLRPMNHLILFLPTLNLYVDATTGVAPFGALPFQEIGKPAIHLSGAGPARRDIPIPSAADSRSEMRTTATLGADGELTGTTETRARGAFGHWLRAAARAIGPNNRSAAAASLLRQHSTPGTGEFAFASPTTPGEEYAVKGTFHLTNQETLLRGGYFSLWTGLRILPRPGDFLAGPLLLKGMAENEPSFCYPGTQHEEITLTLPEGREIGTVPRDQVIETDLVRFRSHWAVDGRNVTATRDFVSNIPGPVCEGPVRAQMAEVMGRIRDDILNQVGIRLDAPPPAPAVPEPTEADSPKN